MEGSLAGEADDCCSLERTADRASSDDASKKNVAGTDSPFRVRVGVVGCGYWGSKHVRILSSSPDVAEVAVIDPDPRTFEGIRSAFPTVRTFPELQSALPHVDALVIATPPCTHAAIASEALRRGKHVLVEKPLATSLAEARPLVAWAHGSGAVLMVGHTFEFNPAVRELKRRLELGELGRVLYIHSARLNLGLYRSDVDVVWDLAAHDVSIMNYLLGSVPSAVAAWGSANARADVRDLAFVRLEYRDLGVAGYAHVSWLDPNKVRKVTVVGSRRMAVYDDMSEEHLRIFDRGVECSDLEITPFERPISYRYGDIVSPHIHFEEPLALEVQHFVECIRDRTVPRTDGRNGLAVIAVLEAISEALATGTIVEVRWPNRPTLVPAKGWNDHAAAGAGR